jgi:hypothetical protein
MISLLTRSLSNPAVVNRLEEQLYKTRSPVYKLFSEESRHNILQAIESERAGSLSKRDGEKALTAVVIQAIIETNNIFAMLILAIIMFPIAVGLFVVLIISS